jgi:Iap family predicted aminopeptidase
VTHAADELEIRPEYLLEVVERLESFRSHPLGFRVAGTPEERAAAAYIAGELRDTGLDVHEERVPVDAWRLEEAFVELGKGTRYECASFGGVPETGPAGISGELVDVGGGLRAQLDRVDVAGRIALVNWWVDWLWPYHVGLELTFRGAAAMIVTSTEGGPYYQAPGALGTFDGVWHAEGVPCVTIRREDAAKLVARAGEPIRVVLRAPLTRGAEATNVVAVMEGETSGAPTIVGGHHDGWFAAAFDDASGVAATVAIARAYSEAGIRPSRPIVFLSHTAEEYGIAHSAYDWCYGAWYQIVVDHPEWSEEAGFYLNVEGCGRPGDPFTVDAPPELAKWARRVCGEAKRDGLLPHGFKLAAPSTWTEVWPFLAAGVPSVNVSTFTREFERTMYHTQYDTSDAMDVDYLVRLTRVCARMLHEADAGAVDKLDFGARARHLRRTLGHLRYQALDDALSELEEVGDRERFTALARGLHGLDGGELARYPHEQTAANVRLLESGLNDLRAGRSGQAARRLARVGLNGLCSALGPDAFRLELARRGRDAPRACWAAQGDPDPGPDLWEELASLRGERGAREGTAWVEESVERHLESARVELEHRLVRMASAVAGRLDPLPQPSVGDIPRAGG